MKKIFLFILFSVFCSCTIEYDGETRLVVESVVTDTDGNPLKGKSIEIVVSDGQNFDAISNGTTDANGRSLLIFPSPKADGMTADVTIAGDENHVEKNIRNISKENFNDYKLTLDNIILFRPDQVTTLQIEFDQSGFMRLDSYRIESETPGYDVDYDYEALLPYETLANFAVAKNNNTLLHYSLTDMTTMMTSENTVVIPIGVDPVTYILTY